MCKCIRTTNFVFILGVLILICIISTANLSLLSIREETHKVDVIKFSQNKALECSRDNNLLDRDSARLLWDFIMLLCRQNGVSLQT